MIIKFNSEDLILNINYFTPPFLVDKSNVTVQITTDVGLTATMESSIDGDDYYEIPETSFTIVSLGGIQSYVDAQPNLYYRIKMDELPTEIKILV